MTKNILITRSKESSKDIANILENQGYHLVFEPLFLVEKFSENKKFTHNKYSFAIVTSSNAAYFMAQSNLDRNIRIYAVGKKTAEIIANFGFFNVSYPAQNNAVALKNLILQQEKSGFALYFHGPIISLDFKKELKNVNFKIENILSYEVIENNGFSKKFLDFAKNEKFDQVLVFSKNSAKILHKLAKTHNLLEYFTESKILAFSEKILAEVRNLGFSNSQTFAKLPVLKDFYDRRNQEN
jgi:uroporphyrinogen-III synthase